MLQHTGTGVAFVFPGQGSQSLGMFRDFVEKDNTLLDTYAEASDALGLDLWQLTQDGPESKLNMTEHTQPALLTAGVASWRLWRKHQGIVPDFMAGHSLGEYTALVCSGSITFKDAVILVRDRGRYMQEAVPEGTGGMAAILGLASDVVNRLCVEAGDAGIVSAANYNSPEQTVIAGQVQAVSRAMELSKAAGAKRAIMLPVSVPSHCALMQGAAEKLVTRLESISFKDCEIPVIQNIDATLHHDADEIKAGLVKQLHQPVRWMQSMIRLKELKCRTIIESGPGKVLTGLLKRIDKELTALSIGDVASFEMTIKEMQT